MQITVEKSGGFLRQEARAASFGRMAFLALGFALLTALGAQVRIPVPGTDVPMTLQPLAVLLAGLLLSPAAAVSAVAIYLAAGTLGAPVFAAGSGGLSGATGGYLAGFLVAAWAVAGLRGGPSASFARLVLAAAVGMFCVHALGVLWRTMFFGGNLGLAISTGFLPFVMKTGVEVFLAGTIASQVRRFRRVE